MEYVLQDDTTGLSHAAIYCRSQSKSSKLSNAFQKFSTKPCRSEWQQAITLRTQALMEVSNSKMTLVHQQTTSVIKGCSWQTSGISTRCFFTVTRALPRITTSPNHLITNVIGNKTNIHGFQQGLVGSFFFRQKLGLPLQLLDIPEMTKTQGGR